ncbi:MAG: AraC family transcriptional regulator [Opitutales bacterium]|nr:AraC family transcriptional regulator [Opitutales bacterium]MDP4777121.1 AraC family transcriptional regulator [Opitutales bacterium]MDP4883308.1 AraC family transcriptional regulator [Opitutales bacterium]
MKAANQPDFVSSQVEASRYVFLDLAMKAQRSFTVTCAGREECAPDYRLTRNGFHYYAVECVVAGKVELTWDGVVHTLGAGSVFAYHLDSQFSLRAIGAERLVKYFLDFSGDEALRLLRASGLIPGSPLVVSPLGGLRELFDQVLDCNRHASKAAQEMGNMLGRLILMRIGEDGRVASPVRKDSHITYSRCRDYIREHFKSLRTMEVVSGACHVDRAYLSRVFKKHAGESPYQFLIRLKMEYAAELLRYRQLPVKVVASELGYEDPFHFSRVFKKTFGLSPQNFMRG